MAAPLVFLVDDDPDFCFLLAGALERKGAVVQTSSSAFGLVNRAAGLTEHPKPNVIVLDVDLVALSGTSALKLLAANAKAVDVPVVVVSASMRDTIEAAIAQHPKARFAAKNGRFAQLADDVLAAVDPA